MTIVAACLKANFSCEWKIFKVIARTLAIIIIEPRENVFLLRFHTRQAVASDISFFSRTAHTNNLFTRHSSYCVYMRLIHARVCVHEKEKKEYF